MLLDHHPSQISKPNWCFPHSCYFPWACSASVNGWRTERTWVLAVGWMRTPGIQVESLTSTWMTVLEAGAFGGVCSYKTGLVFLWNRPQEILPLSTVWGHRQKAPATKQEEGLPQNSVMRAPPSWICDFTHWGSTDPFISEMPLGLPTEASCPLCLLWTRQPVQTAAVNGLVLLGWAFICLCPERPFGTTACPLKIKLIKLWIN